MLLSRAASHINGVVNILNYVRLKLVELEHNAKYSRLNAPGILGRAFVFHLYIPCNEVFPIMRKVLTLTATFDLHRYRMICHV